MKLYKYFWIFIFGSIFGWIIEVLYTLVTMHYFQNHSAVVLGPFDMAYGISAVCLTLLLTKEKNSSYLKLFIIGFIGGSLIEYIISWGQEVLFGSCAWDYSTEFLNINGRICLLYSLFWGVIAILWIKIVYPLIDKLINKMDTKVWKAFAIILFVFLVFDSILTIMAVNRAKAYNKGIEPQNKYEKFLDRTFSNEYLGNMYGAGWEKQK